MAALPLTNKISQSSSRQLNQRIITSNYGDGYEQVAAIGLNSRFDVWSINWEGLTLTERNTFMTFFNTVGLVQSFDWTPPNGVAGKYRIIEAPVETNAGWYYNISIKVKQVFA